MSESASVPGPVVLGDVEVEVPDVAFSGGWKPGPQSQEFYDRFRMDSLTSVSGGTWGLGEGPFISVQRHRHLPDRTPDYNPFPIDGAEHAEAVLGFVPARASLVEACGMSIWAIASDGGIGAVVAIPEASGEAAVLAVTLGSDGDRLADEVADLFAIVFSSAKGPSGERLSTCNDHHVLAGEFARFVAIHNQANDSAPASLADPPDEEFAGVPVFDLDGLLQRSSYVRFKVPVPPEEIEDGLVPMDLPGLVDGLWKADIDLTSGEVLQWSDYGQPVNLQLEPIDGGLYELLNSDQEVIAQLTGHVPNQLVPGAAGETLALKISAEGKATNWLNAPTLNDFNSNRTSHLTYQILEIPTDN